MPLTHFHPATQAWFEQAFTAPTPVQQQAWAPIQRGQPTLIAAPTGSGKTLAAFLCAIDELLQSGLRGELRDQSKVLYISPLKALSNDVQKNLSLPINGIRDKLLESGIADIEIRAWVRSGDSTPGERSRMLRKPPHIIVTTPESLSILLCSDSGRNLLQSIETVIVDEVHALAGNKRGAHLSLSLQRLERVCKRKPRRIGLSATQKPLTEVANYLMADQASQCVIVDTGHQRDWDLQLELPSSPLETIMANEVWEDIYNRLTDLIQQHRTTLIFVNTRRMAERVSHRLAERIGEQAVTAHHGSLSREHRLQAEQRLKSGQLQALVATASLELGIDIGDVDLVCQLGSPRSINSFLQRVGRAGHQVGGVSKGRLFPLSRDDLVECTALLQAVSQGHLDTLDICSQALDVLAQHIVAEAAAGDCQLDELYDCLRQAYPYRNLTRNQLIDLIVMLADGYNSKRGRRAAYLHYDQVNQIIRAKRGARLTAVMNMGAIPDQFDYDVIMLPESLYIGSLNEDFAFESLPGDIFLLGNYSYQIAKVEQGKVYVHDAHGAPPTLPFWLGEAPGRSNELSSAIADLRQRFQTQFQASQLDVSPQSELFKRWLSNTLDGSLSETAYSQLAEYLALGLACFKQLPDRRHILMERFFDESGDMHLVIHSVFGSRINRAWGLALRKRFCRKFNFELQAAADDDHIILSLGPTHSFPLDEVQHYLKSGNVEDILVQALLDAPVFATRWRWNCNISLAVPRMRNGKKVPAQFQRNDAEDLVALVFPDQLACLENISGNREVPDHPLVNQTLHDCLHENMDIDGLVQVLQGIEQGDIHIDCYDMAAPSPLAESIINAKPFAFLDDTPAEERRTLAIQQTPALDIADARMLSNIRPEVIEKVCREAWPLIRNEDELHDTLSYLGYLTDEELCSYAQAPDNLYCSALLQQQRICHYSITERQSITRQKGFWIARERLNEFIAVFGKSYAPDFAPLANAGNKTTITDADSALDEILHSRLEVVGPVYAATLAEELGLAPSLIEQSLLRLEQSGVIIRGQFFPNPLSTVPQWCNRRLLARIQQQNRQVKRGQYRPVSPARFMRFLFDWQGINDKGIHLDALYRTLQQLEGVALSPGNWESQVLPIRIAAYTTQMLDELCATGRIAWLRRNHAESAQRKQAISSTPITLVPREHLHYWLPESTHGNSGLSATANKILALMQQQGALFFSDIVGRTGLLRTQVESALGLLVAQGLVSADHFSGIRALVAPANKKPKFGKSISHPRNIESAGRWWLLPQHRSDNNDTSNNLQRHVCLCLLRRYGVVFRKLLENENQLPPWRELLYEFRRMEDRGEVMGGRFVESFAGEQFALPEAVSAIRKLKDSDDAVFYLAAADPLNLSGIITGEHKIAVNTGSQIAYQNGNPVACFKNGKIHYLTDSLSADTRQSIESYWRASRAPQRRPSEQAFAYKH